MALVINCGTQNLLGWHLLQTSRAGTSLAALERSSVHTLGRVPSPFLLRSNNGLAFKSRDYKPLRSSSLLRNFTTLHCSQQNRMVERVIRRHKEQHVHRHHADNHVHAYMGECRPDHLLQPRAPISRPEDIEVDRD